VNQLLFQFLNSFACKTKWVDDIIIFFAEYFGYLLILLFVGIVVFNKKIVIPKKRIFIFGAVSVFLSRLIITEIIRAFYYSPRPFAENTVNQLLIHNYTGSFPSGHAAFYFALATVVMLTTRMLATGWRIWGVVFFIGAVLIGLARVVAGIHWPLDILGGAVVGVFSSWIIYYFFKSKLQKLPKNSIINSNAET